MPEKYTLAEAKPRIEQFLDKVFDLAGFDLDYAVSEGETPHPDFENPDLLVRFSGADVDLLLGNKAELLLALEQLTMEALGMPAEEHSRMCFDANDYRVLRIEELRLSAVTAAEQVKRTRVPFHFNPMSSRERRILHLSLRNETGVRSESTGVGPHRQVVVMPADMTTVPEPIIRPLGPPRTGGIQDRRGGPPRRDGRDQRRSGPPRGRRPS